MCSLSYVHVYRIEYVSYRQGPYPIRIVSAADRIVPALMKKNYRNQYRSIIGYPRLHYSAMLRYVPWENWLGKSRSHE